MKGLYDLDKKLEKVGNENCYISEITLAELKYGVSNSIQKKKNKKVLDDFINGIQIIPIYNSLDLYANEKTRLRKSGFTIDEFDLLIGVTAVSSSASAYDQCILWILASQCAELFKVNFPEPLFGTNIH
ncbi:MAG: PIN domain-containing protein [Flavobacteriaceae bacterium]|nr:PIN domain-containing protein [Flavobacteriaceae bacterium]